MASANPELEKRYKFKANDRAVVKKLTLCRGEKGTVEKVTQDFVYITLDNGVRMVTHETNLQKLTKKKR